jgi:chromosome segregation ATPase
MSFPSKLSSSSSRVVESDSVQSQFAALTRDRDRLRWEVESADRQRRQQEAVLAELRTLQTSLSTKLQTAHASLGVFEKKKALLETERVRLVQLLKKDRDQLQASQETLQELTETQRLSKQSFLQEMHEWNDELESLLHQKEEQEWKRLVGTETLSLVPIDLGHTKDLWQEAVEKHNHEALSNHALIESLKQWRNKAHSQQVRYDMIVCMRMVIYASFALTFLQSILFYSIDRLGLE